MDLIHGVPPPAWPPGAPQPILLLLYDRLPLGAEGFEHTGDQS